MRVAMITTQDNPHDPFDDYDSWFAWDSIHGYHTPSYLARIAYVSDETSAADQQFIIEEAIDEIIKINPEGMYKKVVREL